jgi:hypothetical protein
MHLSMADEAPWAFAGAAPIANVPVSARMATNAEILSI